MHKIPIACIFPLIAENRIFPSNRPFTQEYQNLREFEKQKHTDILSHTYATDRKTFYIIRIKAKIYNVSGIEMLHSKLKFCLIQNIETVFVQL